MSRSKKKPKEKKIHDWHALNAIQRKAGSMKSIRKEKEKDQQIVAEHLRDAHDFKFDDIRNDEDFFQEKVDAQIKYEEGLELQRELAKDREADLDEED